MKSRTKDSLLARLVVYSLTALATLWLIAGLAVGAFSTHFAVGPELVGWVVLAVAPMVLLLWRVP